MATPVTFFATAERATTAEIARQHHYFANTVFTRDLLDTLPNPLVILNGQRQIVFANRPAIDLIGRDEALVYGLRPGEALACEHACDAAGGCGTAPSCRSCGLVDAVIKSLDGSDAVSECRFTRNGATHTAFDLRVSVRPLDRDGDRFSLVIIDDIAHEKRRYSLERVFFHDLMNSLGSVRGLLELVRSGEQQDQDELFELMSIATQQAIDEIVAQRTLVLAENRELHVHREALAVAVLLQECVAIFRQHEVAVGKNLHLVADGSGLELVSDGTLLRRILVNMLKNALEATPRSGTVEVGARDDGEKIVFWVHNSAAIPAEHQSQIFQRSFSTRGAGRGLGTYSMRLLSEYLHANVSFISTPRDGTTFYFTCPRLPQD